MTWSMMRFFLVLILFLATSVSAGNLIILSDNGTTWDDADISGPAALQCLEQHIAPSTQMGLTRFCGNATWHTDAHASLRFGKVPISLHDNWQLCAVNCRFALEKSLGAGAWAGGPNTLSAPRRAAVGCKIVDDLAKFQNLCEVSYCHSKDNVTMMVLMEIYY
ncbi:hypothetical protein KJ359_010443 [Pestalotiopsis sp. 9143b]|nr:hypothetical protein KJ359_010443 [Pestalotiopsis sp. 9143b]